MMLLGSLHLSIFVALSLSSLLTGVIICKVAILIPDCNGLVMYILLRSFGVIKM